MKISILSTAYIREGESFAAGAERMRRHGYEATDYQGFVRTEEPLWQLSEAQFERRLAEERRILTACGLSVCQTHGPWRYPMRDATEADRAERFSKMAKAIRGTAILGCDRMAIHNLMPFGVRDTDPKAVREINGEFFCRLAEVGREYGVTVCLENMPYREQVLARVPDMLSFIKSLGTEWVRMCLDTGHCAVQGESPADALRLIGREDLCILHVHDNDGTRDQHLRPGEGVIDWAAFSEALTEIGFTGALSLETAVPRELSPDAREEAELALCRRAYRLAGRTE